MRTAILVAVSLMLTTLPASSQDSGTNDNHGPSYGHRDRDLEDLLSEIDDRMSGRGSIRGASFLLRSGEATLAVRCDPRDSMRSCVDAATTLLERAHAAMPPGTGPGGSSPGTPPARSP
jgi:hypothetical protein